MLRGGKQRPPSTSTSPVRIGVVDGRSPTQRALSTPLAAAAAAVGDQPVADASDPELFLRNHFFFFGCRQHQRRHCSASSGTGFFLRLFARAARMHSPPRQAAREKHSAAPAADAAAVKAASGLTAQRSLSVTLPVRLASPEQWVLGAPPPGMRWGPRACDRTERRSHRPCRPRQIASLSLPLARAQESARTHR